ncbi:MAG: lipid-A-disaccharide synthase N-terminal domain-containing protein [Cyclobacteriaceae bacterium]|nr:lipid-A-disaccharide synthase N-terminal domain-containing protein [Cyclobacteriaceae bacterium]
MNSIFIYALGFLAQAFFGSRMIIQWIKSEKAKKVVSPTLFWQTSLMGSFLFLVYGILRNDAVIILGQFLSFYIYIRNLQIQQEWKKIPAVIRWVLLPLPFISLGWVLWYDAGFWNKLMAHNDFADALMIVGTCGQLMLNLRFFYQWYYAERYQLSVLPLGFWLISLAGSIMIIIYAVYRLDPGLLISQGMGFVVYVRNIMIYRHSNLTHD